MKMSMQGKSFLIQLEGFKTRAYKDTNGYSTIGVGHLIQFSEKELLTKTLTEKEVHDLFDKDIAKYELHVTKELLGTTIKQHEFDALVSICYNIGMTAFEESTFLARIKSRNTIDSIVKAIMLWIKNRELINRRSNEARLYKDANYSIDRNLNWSKE